jgi:cytochrome c oxidase cbb3-type subunit III
MRRLLHPISVAALLCLLSLAAAAQQPQAPAPSGRGRIGGIGIGAYPQRTVEDQAAVDRGRATFSANCAFCHGADIRGGDGGPSLLRSSLVLDDQNGELIGPVIRAGRPDRGMPAFAMTPEQISDIAAFMHSFRVAGYDASRDRPTSIVVGNAAAGETFFASTCASCHSATGDLQGVATRIADPRLLQQSWLMPGSAAGRGAPPPLRPRPPTATVTLPSGEKVEGQLDRVDDFAVALRMPDGTRRSFRIGPGVEVNVADPLQAHRDLLKTYRDADIHNVTAYLSTLK